MVVHVDADGAGQNLRDPRILRFGLRPQPFRREQHRDIRPDRSRQKFSPSYSGASNAATFAPTAAVRNSRRV